MTGFKTNLKIWLVEKSLYILDIEVVNFICVTTTLSYFDIICEYNFILNYFLRLLHSIHF